jgi:Na+-transporting NADH:ubiquinone oxidoreductase subunit A
MTVHPGEPRQLVIRKGLDIPLAGAPAQVISDAPPVNTVALLGIDYLGLKPQLAVDVGDRVALGQPLFTSKKQPAIAFTAPGAGEVLAIHRGARRVLQSVVVRLEGEDAVDFGAVADDELATLDADTVRGKLLASGLWTAFRTRPYSKLPAPDAAVPTLFVTAIDTRPLAGDVGVVVADAADDFQRGLRVLLQLGGEKLFLCTAPAAGVPVIEDDRLVHVEFAGPHPAGLVGSHIHFLEPVSESRQVWHLGYQDVIAIGRLIATGRLPTERIIALGGPMARQPRLLRTRAGASTEDLVAGEVTGGAVRVISGSVLSGHRAAGPLAWLGRYHDQVSLLAESRAREFLAWMRPGVGRYSALRAFVGNAMGKGRYALTTSQNGSPRAMVPIGSFERVMPLDLLPTPLLKALLVGDSDRAKELGCLELDEEDLALCSFVCNGKYEYGPFLRMTLDDIEVNG